MRQLKKKKMDISMPVRFRCVCVYPVGEDMQFLGCCVVDNYRSHPVNPNPTRNYDPPPPRLSRHMQTHARTHTQTYTYVYAEHLP